jgi:hypothetical protein
MVGDTGTAFSPFFAGIGAGAFFKVRFDGTDTHRVALSTNFSSISNSSLI